MSASKSNGYQRSWKNLLIDRGYQLRFTLFMVGLSTVLVSGLGYWVLREGRKATTVGINEVLGRPCPPAPVIAPPGSDVTVDEITRMKPAPSAAPAPTDTEGQIEGQGEEAAAGDGSDDQEPVGDETKAAPEMADTAETAEADDDRPRAVLDESTMALDGMKNSLRPSAGFVAAVVQHYQCRHEQVARISSLRAGYDRIALLLVSAGVLLILGLTLYGIKMTHRVAGPLHKVSLYFDKMRQGRYDEVYDLRRGDQLVDFYDQFKTAHDGVKMMQEQDIEHLRGMIEAAEADDLASRSPELAALLGEMREALARKEKSLE